MDEPVQRRHSGRYSQSCLDSDAGRGTTFGTDLVAGDRADSGVPAILEYIPYRKGDMVRTRDERNHAFFAAAGYACLRVDMRGSGDSEGIKPDMYDVHELDDAIAVIEWIASQQWCDGSVGMMGTSWGGTASYQAAMRRPLALKAIIAVCATNNRFDDDIHHMGGSILTDTVEWGATLPAILAAPPDPEIVGDGWRENWRQRLQALAFPLEHWVREETRSDYWRNGALNEDPSAIDVPILAIGGWADRYSNTVMNVLSDGGANIWGIVGPWGHHYPDLGEPGPGMGFQEEAVRWWDHWLKGVDNGVSREPKLRVWMQEFDTPSNRMEHRTGRWVAETEWPGPNITQQTFHLSNGMLSDDERPTDEGTEESFQSVPYFLGVGRASGDTGYFGRVGGMPLDQRDDDERSLIIETAPLPTPIDVLGTPVLEVVYSSNGLGGQLVARLNDVTNDGAVARVSYAAQNLSLDERGQPLGSVVSDAFQSARLTLHNTAYRFGAGHRIRLSLSSSYWPNLWPSKEDTDLKIDTARMRLILPVRPLADDEPAPKLTSPSVPPGSPNRQVTQDGGLVRFGAEEGDSPSTVGWRQDYTEVFHKDIDLSFGYKTEARHTLRSDDPLSAKTRVDHFMRIGRAGWIVDITSFAKLTCEPDTFVLNGGVSVEENGVAIFERTWNPKVPRRWG